MIWKNAKHGLALGVLISIGFALYYGATTDCPNTANYTHCTR